MRNMRTKYQLTAVKHTVAHGITHDDLGYKTAIAE